MLVGYVISLVVGGIIGAGLYFIISDNNGKLLNICKASLENRKRKVSELTEKNSSLTEELNEFRQKIKDLSSIVNDRNKDIKILNGKLKKEQGVTQKLFSDLEYQKKKGHGYRETIRDLKKDALGIGKYNKQIDKLLYIITKGHKLPKDVTKSNLSNVDLLSIVYKEDKKSLKKLGFDKELDKNKISWLEELIYNLK